MIESRPNLPQEGAEFLAFLFTDLAGSTQLWERFPQTMSKALERHDAILQEAILSSGGRVVKTTGDGMMAIFPMAAGGVSASVTAQRSFASEQWPEIGALRVRMGLHVGEAEHRGDDYFGPTVNRTARIMAAGHGGQVLLSSAAAALTSDRLPEGAALLDLGEHRLKDLGRPERVFQLLCAGLESAFPPLNTRDRGVNNLPVQATAFVGRRNELAELARRFADPAVRLLTLTGPGGTGKTSLAIRVAAEQVNNFRDGVFFVDLSAARDTDAVLNALGRALQLGDGTDRPILEELTERLRDLQRLLVLDNFEQVTAAALVLAHLLGECPELRLLVTSREALHVRAEQVYQVQPLTLPPTGGRQTRAAQLADYEAVQLFVERASAARADFELTDGNAAAIAEICRRLDGLPLAIELAAARLRIFSPDALLERLQHRLELLRTSTRDVPLRQQTLRASIEWSYQLLEPAEQWLFDLLAVFFDADFAAVEVVASEAAGADGLDFDVLDGLASLLDKSLLRQVNDAEGEPRLVMLETIREFAAERLALRPEFSAQARHAHARYYAELAQRQRGLLMSGEREEALATLAGDLENLRIAWRHWVAEAELDQLNKLADSLLILCDARGWYHDAVALTTDLLNVLSTTPSAPDHVSQEITLRTKLARALMTTRGYTPEVEEEFARALELFEGNHTAPHLQASVLRGLAFLYMMRVEFEKIVPLAEEILALAERENDPAMRIDGLLLMGISREFHNDIKGGYQCLVRAIDLFDSVPKRTRILKLGTDPRIPCLTASSFYLWQLGSPDPALARAQAAIVLAAQLDHPFTSAYAQFHVGLLHLWRQEPELVLEQAIRTLEIANEYDFQIWAVVGTCLLGAAQTALGQHETGLAEIRRGLKQYQGLRTPPIFWPMLLQLEAHACAQANRTQEGLTSLNRALEMIGPEGGAYLGPEFRILKGDLLVALAAEHPAYGAEAEVYYRWAFDRAAALELRMPQLRAATRLGRRALGGEQAEQAARDLRAVLETFTDGFETVDLREARECLAALDA